MTILVSINGNMPELPPDRIRLSSGLTRTDSSSYTIEELQDAGYIVVNPKPQDGFEYGWNGTNWFRLMK